MIDKGVVDYIKTAQAQGKSRETLYQELLGRGLSIAAIEEHFHATTATEDKEDTQKKTIRIIVTIGALLVGAGIFSFIAANWQEMTKPVKIGVILVAMFGTYALGWYADQMRNMKKTGGALLMLGTIIYGAGIFLIAQMFHVRANWPDGFILWMLGSIAMAFALDSFPHFYLAIILGFIAAVGHPIEIFTGTFGYRAFLLTSSLLLLVVTVVTFVTGWLMRRRLPPELKEL